MSQKRSCCNLCIFFARIYLLFFIKTYNKNSNKYQSFSYGVESFESLTGQFSQSKVIKLFLCIYYNISKILFLKHIFNTSWYYFCIWCESEREFFQWLFNCLNSVSWIVTPFMSHMKRNIINFQIPQFAFWSLFSVLLIDLSSLWTMPGFEKKVNVPIPRVWFYFWYN